MSKRNIVVLAAIAAVLVVVVFVGLAVRVVKNSEQSVNASKQVVFTMETEGGYCAGPCDQTQLTVYRDGSWKSEYASRKYSGQFDARTRSEFQSAMVKQVQTLEDSKKREHVCDSWSDGTDTTMTFYVTGERVRVSSCDYDFGNFDEIYAIIGEPIGQGYK